MARSDSFARKWASAPAQFERPSNTLIDRGWAGGAGEDPPEAKWENWWHNRVDEALGELEALGAMRWFGDVSYSEMAEVSHGGVIYIAARPSNGIEPGSAADIGHWQRKPLGTRAFMQISSSQDIPDSFEGMALIDASAGVVTVTLPASNAELGIRDVIVHRADNSGNRLVVQTTGTDRIKFHTHLRAEGYPFIVLMGAGDYWHLRSDGAGNWWPIARLDSDALGRPVFETTTLFSPGGWGALAGVVFNRAEWPWLWDHAQQSGMLASEVARAGMEGGWTSGDGVATFRGPEGRGEFLRLLDDGRGLDASRAAGSRQAGTILIGDNDASPSIFGYKSARDMAADAPPAGAAVRTIQTITSTGVNETTVSGGDYLGVVRPVNIAYPGRIKLI